MAGGVELRVRVQPRARRPGLGGLSPDGGALRVAVTEALGVAPSGVEVASGAASRLKLLRVAGDPARLGERIGKVLA